MKKIYNSLFLILFSFCALQGQNCKNKTCENQDCKGYYLNISHEKDSIRIEVDTNYLISSKAFNEIIYRDLNFYILGENAPNEGIEFELNEDKNKISIGGFVKKFDIPKLGKNWLFTLNGELETSEGFFFFDDIKKSSSAKITANFFKSVGKAKRGYKSVDSTKTQIANIKRALLLTDSIHFKYDRYKILFERVKKILKDEIEITYQSYKDSIRKYNCDISMIDDISNYDIINSKTDSLSQQSIVNILKKNYSKSKETELYGGKRKVIGINSSVEDPTCKKCRVKKPEVIIDLDVPNFDYLTLIDDYLDAKEEVKNIKQYLMKNEINLAKDLWTYKTNYYVGISPYYQLESKTIYNFQEGVPFEKLFENKRQDLFGLTATLNAIKQWKNNANNYLIGRILGTLGRGTNGSDFKSKEYTFTPQPVNNISLGVDTNGNEILSPILTPIKKTGLTAKDPYRVGATFGLEGEMYAGLAKGFGLFGRIGYYNTRINQKSKERYPTRAGILINIKTKSEIKNIVVLQLFADRSNLNLNPSGEGGDLRIGFGIGLPINLMKDF